jgi:predicted short-subunit dehydrogenase-like oxidoreductase (DUF2520 family)
MGKQVAIAVIGKGKLGSTIAAAVGKSSKYTLHSHIAARSRSFKKLADGNGPDVLFIVTKDSMIASVAKAAVKECGKNLSLIVQCAGSISPSILPQVKNVNRLTLHPIQTFASTAPSQLNGISWMAGTSSSVAKKFAWSFVKELGGKQVIEVKEKDLALYHLITVFASNFPVLLGGAIEKLSKSIGKSDAEMKKAIEPLLRQAVTNLLSGKAKDVLTGPFARKDHATILKHRIALKKQPLALRKIYEGFYMMSKEL